MKFKAHKTMLAPPKYSGRWYADDGRRVQTVRRPFKKTLFVLSAITCFLAATLILMLDLRNNAELAEWWTTHIEAGLERLFGTLTGWIPFSVLEFFIVCLIGLGVFMYVRLIVNLGRKRFRAIAFGALSICTVAMYVLNMYVMTMAFAYYRAEMPIPQSDREYDGSQTVAVVRYFLDDYNKLADSLPRDKNGCVECPYTFSELAERIKIEYARLDGDYFNEYTPQAKPIVNSWLMSQMLITGITFLPTGEASVNTAAPPTSQTVTLAHELAHSKGVAREGDAELLARYILLTADDGYLRYCGYYAAFYNLLDALRLAGEDDAYIELGLSISPLVSAEQRYAYEYWNSQPNIIGQIAEFFNNWYLESNGAENGTGSYDDGNKSEIVIPTDPITGEPEKDPDTNEPIKIILYSQVQKMFFAIYEAKND